jgi:Cupin-like domain
MQIDRHSRLSERVFIDEYQTANRPVIVTDAMDGWEAKSKWTPEFFKRVFGEYEVQVYNDLFDIIDITTLEEYLQENFGRSEDCSPVDYVRWYTRFKNLDFAWADEVFDRLKGDWNHPYFLPSTSYVLPFCPYPKKISILNNSFPFKGLFISARGAQTRLHRDPCMTEAVLCQIYGAKKLILYSPDQAGYLVNENDFVNIDDPDLEKFSLFPKASPSFQDMLWPGEILFIPSGWFHHVETVSDSISITWNWCYSNKLDAFCDYLIKAPYDKELEVIRFFLPSEYANCTTAKDIVNILRNSFHREPIAQRHSP